MTREFCFDIDNMHKEDREKIKSIQYYTYYHGSRDEDVFFKAWYDWDGKCLKREEVHQNEFDRQHNFYEYFQFQDKYYKRPKWRDEGDDLIEVSSEEFEEVIHAKY